MRYGIKVFLIILLAISIACVLFFAGITVGASISRTSAPNGSLLCLAGNGGVYVWYRWDGQGVRPAGVYPAYCANAPTPSE